MLKIILLVFVTFSLSACTSPEGTVKKFYKTAFAGKSDEIGPMFIVEQSPLATPFIIEAINKGDFKDCKDLKIVKAKDQPEDKSLATAGYTESVLFDVDFVCKDDKKHEQIFAIKKDGKYQVAYKK